MATLDLVMTMLQQGMPEQDIVNRLQNEGISPREIYDSLNQAKIKNAVSPPQGNDYTYDMQPSILPPESQMQQQILTQQQPKDQSYEQAPSPQMYPQEQGYAAAFPPQQSQEYYAQQPYGGQEYYAQTGAVDTETISEIAEQVASEKIGEFKRSVGDLGLFKSVVQDKLADLDDRLKRIEASMDKLNHAIIGKMGEFGESSSMIQRDIENLHETVAKLMNPLVDNYNELKKANARR